MGIHQQGEVIDLAKIKAKWALEEKHLVRKLERDRELEAIIKGQESRLLLIIGPCSADNEEAVLDYARRLSKLQDELVDKLFILMRVYTTKPRTTGDGYKGLMHNRESDSVSGLEAVRKLHYRVISETGLTTADEMLYPAHYPVIADLVSYHAVGARSVENQEHRFLASGLDCPVGMKNPTSGQLDVMFNAIYAAQNPQAFTYHYQEVVTDGNSLAHAVLRGGRNSIGRSCPNYSHDDLLSAIKQYQMMGLKHSFLVVDANHDNSGKDYLKQIAIVREVLASRQANADINRYVRGFMLESYLEDGRQDEPVVFGQSLTDPCLGWEKTESLIREIYQNLSENDFSITKQL